MRARSSGTISPPFILNVKKESMKIALDMVTERQASAGREPTSASLIAGRSQIDEIG